MQPDLAAALARLLASLNAASAAIVDVLATMRVAPPQELPIDPVRQKVREWLSARNPPREVVEVVASALNDDGKLTRWLRSQGAPNNLAFRAIVRQELRQMKDVQACLRQNR